MAKLFGKMEDEEGIEVHKIANRELCANFYYGSREQSVRAVRVCARIMPAIGRAYREEAIFTVDFFSPDNKIIHSHTEPYPMPLPMKTVKAVV